MRIREREYRHLDEAFVRAAPHVLERSVSDGHREPSVATVRHLEDTLGTIDMSDRGRALPDTVSRASGAPGPALRPRAMAPG